MTGSPRWAPSRPPGRRPCAAGRRRRGRGSPWAALLVERYLSNAALFVLCVLRSVRDHHNLLHYSPRLKKTCVRQVVLDKCFPLITLRATVSPSGTHSQSPQSPRARRNLCLRMPKRASIRRGPPRPPSPPPLRRPGATRL